MRQAMTASDVGLRRNPPPPAGTAMYCLPSLPRYVDGIECAGASSFSRHSSLPLRASNRAEDAVDRRADEHEVAGRRDAAAEARRARSA